MKKFFIIFGSLITLFLAGELASSPKTITGQRDDMNVWTVNHFFNTFSTEYIGPINDTTEITIIGKERVGKSYMIRVSDGNQVTLLKSREIHNVSEIGDTVKLVTTYEPMNRNKYKIKHTIIK